MDEVYANLLKETNKQVEADESVLFDQNLKKEQTLKYFESNTNQKRYDTLRQFEKDTGFKYNDFDNGISEEKFDQYLQEKKGITGQEFEKATTNFLQRGIGQTVKMAVGGFTNVARAGSGFGEKIGSGIKDTSFGKSVRDSSFGKSVAPIATKGQKFLEKNLQVGDTSLTEDSLNLLEGVSDIAVSVGMPIGTTIFNTASETDTVAGDIVRGLGEVMAVGGEYANKFPGLSNFRDTLNPRDQQRFDMFVGGGLFGVISGAKIRNKQGKLDFKALKDTSIIEAFLDIESGKVPQGTVAGEVVNLGINAVKGTKNFLQKKIQKTDFGNTGNTNFLNPKKTSQNFDRNLDQDLSSISSSPVKFEEQKFDTTPEFEQKKIEQQKYSNLLDEVTKKENESKIESERLTQKIKDLDSQIAETDTKSKTPTLKNYDEKNPSHLLYRSLESKLKPKFKDGISNGDFVQLKDGRFGEISENVDGSYSFNTSKTYSPKKVDRITDTIQKDDIDSTFEFKRDHIKFDDPENLGIDYFVKMKQETALTSTQSYSMEFDNFDRSYNDYSISELSDVASSLVSQIKETPTTSPDLKYIQHKLDYIKSKLSNKKLIQDSHNSLSIIDLYKSVKNKEMYLGQAGNIIKDSIRQWFKTVFSSDTIFSTIEQVRKVSPTIYKNMMRATTQKYNNISHSLPLFDDLKKHFSSKKTRAQISLDFYSSADRGIDPLNKEQRTVFDNIHSMLSNSGFELGKKENYVPHVVNDYKGLVEYVTQKDFELPIIKELLETKEKELGRKLTLEEKGDIINALLYDDAFSKSRDGVAYFSGAEHRIIKKITPDIMRFYDDPYTAIQKYLSKAFDNFEMLQSLGYPGDFDIKNPKTDFILKPLDPSKKIKKTAGTVTSAIDKMVIDGDLNYKDGERLTKLLIDRFSNPIPTNAVQKAIPIYKDIIDIMNVANPISAMSNLKDWGVSAYMYGYGNTFSSIGKAFLPKKLKKYFDRYIKIDDLGLDGVGLEFSEKSAISKFKDIAMKISGFNVLDRIGKEVSINASYKSWQDYSKKGDSRFSKNILGKEKMDTLKKNGLNDSEIKDFLSDMRSGKLTDNVKYVLLDDLYKLQPVDKNSIPANYNHSITGKLFYKYKTYMLKRIELYISEFFDVNPKKEPKKFAQRGARLITFVLPMLLFGMTVDEAKDFLLRRETSIRDSVFTNILEMTGLISKYNMYLFESETSLGDYIRYITKKDKYEEKGKDTSDMKFISEKSIAQNIWGTMQGLWTIGGIPLTPFQTAINDISEYLKSSDDISYDWFNKSYGVSRIPVFGKMYYWNFGAGAERELKSNIIRQSTPGFENRTLNEILSPSIDFDGQKLYYANIVNVVDGDTIQFKPTRWEKFRMTSFEDLIQGKLHPSIDKDGLIKVRFHGVDTPETVKQGQQPEYFGKKASGFSKELIGKDVLIMSDYMGDKYDKYHRFLGVVKTLPETANLLYQVPYLANALDYDDRNAKMIKGGYAKVTGSYGFSQKELYYEMQKIAKEKGIGVWDKEKEEQFYLENPDAKPQKIYKYKKN